MHGGNGEEAETEIEIEIETELIRGAAANLTDEHIDMERIDSVRRRDVQAIRPDQVQG